METHSCYGVHSVFIKTAQGREEISRRSNKLSTRQRQVLIMMDGSKSLGVMTALLPLSELKDTVSFLIQHGFIAPLEHGGGQSETPVMNGAAATTHENPGAHVADTSTGLGRENTLTQNPDVVRQVKDFMTTTAHTCLGLLGADVIQRIERARDAAQLMTVVGHWHMALRESRQGNRFAGSYLEQVKAALTGRAQALAVEHS